MHLLGMTARTGVDCELLETCCSGLEEAGSTGTELNIEMGTIPCQKRVLF